MLGNLDAATAARFLGPLMPDPRCGWRAAWMGYVVFGAGAIGAVVGGCLFQAGFEVTLIARGVLLQALQPNGLRLEPPADTGAVGVAAVGHPREIDWATGQVVLMAVKGQQSLGRVERTRRGCPA